MKVAALVPAKAFSRAKRRLAPLLSAAERERLAEAMFRDTLAALARAPGLAEIFVVAADRRVALLARALGASVIAEEREAGESAAVAPALEELERRGAGAVLIVPGDIPLVRAEDIEEILGRVPPPPSAVLAPSHDRLGTNALLVRPPRALPPAFGYGSFRRHLERAERCGLNAVVVENERIALDLDEPEDLLRLVERPGATATHRTLDALGIERRLRGEAPAPLRWRERSKEVRR
jgi:2-phospho-L-lactate guanylyltransferase